MTGHTADDLRELAIQILVGHDTSRSNAEAVADALLAAQIDGHAGHGLSRLPQYAAQSASGKVDGHATPAITEVGPAAIRIDAGNGFAFPAIATAIEDLETRTRANGISIAAIHRSHHFGAGGYHVERLARKGLIGFLFGNSPKAIAPWGGSEGLFGTNPIAFAAPRPGREPLVIDLSLSKVARGKIMVAAKAGDPIPEGWAFDKEGHPTTDAAAALGGTMAPMGDAKGAALVLMVEILAAALCGANFGYEASSFFTADGEPPAVGQCLIAINPGPVSAETFSGRLEALLQMISTQDGARLPGNRRLEARAAAERAGVSVPESLYAELRALAEG